MRQPDDRLRGREVRVGEHVFGATMRGAVLSPNTSSARRRSRPGLIMGQRGQNQPTRLRRIPTFPSTSPFGPRSADDGLPACSTSTATAASDEPAAALSDLGSRSTRTRLLRLTIHVDQGRCAPADADTAALVRASRQMPGLPPCRAGFRRGGQSGVPLQSARLVQRPTPQGSAALPSQPSS